MKRICLIIPNFGRFPNYFNLWLKTASYNDMVDFLIFTDVEIKEEIPDNVIIRRSTLIELHNKLEKIMNCKIRLEKPYKICDYRILYGSLFSEYIKDYEFWGHCDLDIIWGNIADFLTDDILDNYDRIYERGHLTLYRNCVQLNYLWKCMDSELIINYKDMCTTDYCCHFDELPEWNIVLKRMGMRCYEQVDALDVRHQYYRFILDRGKNKDSQQIFEWNNGKMLRYYVENHDVHRDEWIYVHLQKRDMSIMVDFLGNKFDILPEKFVDSKEKTLDYILKMSPDIKIWTKYLKKRVPEIYSNIKSGALKIRMLRRKRRKMLRL